jgi:membrane-associated phospholipid phosphatase
MSLVMNIRLNVFLLMLLLLPLLVTAQQKDTLVKKLDSLSKQTDSLGIKQKNNISAAAYNENTKMTLPIYFSLLLDDIKQQVSAPFNASGRDWLRIGGFALLTTGCALFADKPINRAAIDIRNRSSSIVSASSYVTNFGGLYEGYTLAAFAAYGYIFKKEKTKTTVFLATQAYLTAGAIETTLKYLTGRQRPSYYDPKTGLNNPSWHGPFFEFTKDKNGARPANSSYTSFPSGHTTVAFAAATVFALEYKDSKFIPIIAYSAATMIGLSRLIENQHWSSDVLVGAMLGYLSGRQVVNNYHRYSKIKSTGAKKKNTLVFNLNCAHGILLPGFVYTFR